MARGVSLGEMVVDLRRELRIAESPALGKNTREMHIHALRSTQERLLAEYKWPFMKIFRDVPMEAGERYYAFPADMDMENVVEAFFQHGNTWMPMGYGINPLLYNGSDSDIDQRSDPPIQWSIYRDPDDGVMFEVWPIPSTNGSILRFQGTKTLAPLIADADVSDLDGLLIVLFAATDLGSEKDRQFRLGKATTHFAALKRQMSKRRMFVMGGGMPVIPRHREIIVTYATAHNAP